MNKRDARDYLYGALMSAREEVNESRINLENYEREVEKCRREGRNPDASECFFFQSRAQDVGVAVGKSYA